MKHFPKNPFPPSLAFFLDNPVRYFMTDRRKILGELGLKEGDFVLELGCGPGFFTPAISEIVGNQGRVYAQDVEEAMIRKLNRKTDDLSNVFPLLSSSVAINIEGDTCDAAFCANVFEEIYKEDILEESLMEIDRVLKKYGILILKEHSLGGTGKVIDKVEKLLIRMGYKKELFRKKFISYEEKFRKWP